MNPIFLLDSSVCIPVLRRRAALGGLPDPDATTISALVAAELWSGVERGGDFPRHRARLEVFLGLFPILDFTHAAARHYGEIRADLEKRGAPIGLLDSLIAAHARSLGATLVTTNVREFRRVKGLKLLAWK